MGGLEGVGDGFEWVVEVVCAVGIWPELEILFVVFVVSR